MGVYIKGLEMPKGCIYENEKGKTEYCLLLNHNDIPYCTYIEDGIPDPEVAIGIDERPCYCPLVEVLEPHGDLIDRDNAYNKIFNEMCGTGFQSKASHILKSVLYTPTVIEAERDICEDESITVVPLEWAIDEGAEI